jgi:hypothetical protein
VTTLESFSPISLDDLTAQAQLLRRFDTKYIIHLNQLPEIYTALSSRMSVLEHHGLRCSPYTTVYFDDAELRTYHDHLKGRRKRFKIRTRSYSDPTLGFLEVKMKKPRGQTLKVRWPYDISHIGSTLGDNEMMLINDALRDSFIGPIRDAYSRTLDTTFHRTTLFDNTTCERITIDTQLVATLRNTSASDSYTPGTSVDLGQHCAIIEIKSPRRVGDTHRLFTHLGIREASISKYCVGLSALRTDLVNAPWREALKFLQGAGQQ